jgi:eukaryotic-like serine/threonine-protein kinase
LMGLVEGYLHLEAKGIVHRDIKTSNIMMAVSGPKLIDFGFADHIAFEKPDIVYNVGSPAYMAP